MVGIDQVNRLLEKRIEGRSLEENESIALIHASIIDDIAQNIIKTAAMLERPHKNKIFALPPLYVDSICENRCIYCNFREDGDSLSYEEFRTELKALLSKGYRSIELVFGQNPSIFRRKEPFKLRDQQFDISSVIKYFEIAKGEIDSAGGGMLTLNAPPLDKDSYKQLKKNGLDCFLLWAETFNPMQYARLHPGHTPKTEQRYRLES
ncbi:MAG: hypothetical protein NT001_02600, partial [Candidatus Woesearchaeota archaeon]|nr:hypothetical protein [Candidatus Woesearchaeota archaeon]